MQFDFKKSLDLDLKNFGLTLWWIALGVEKYLMNYLTELGLILWYIGIRLEKYSGYLAGFELILWYIRLGLKKYWMNSDLFYYNQAEMLLEKYENLLELSVKQLII